MLNAIQHGMMIADLQIRRKEQQCGLCNIGDWGEGLNHVGEKMALVGVRRALVGLFLAPKNGARKKGFLLKKKIGGNEWAGPPRNRLTTYPFTAHWYHRRTGNTNSSW
jgi:hypothetical protein